MVANVLARTTGGKSGGAVSHSVMKKLPNRLALSSRTAMKLRHIVSHVIVPDGSPSAYHIFDARSKCVERMGFCGSDEVTPQPLQFIGCDAADAVIAYAADRPRSLPVRLFGGSVGNQISANSGVPALWR